MYRKKDASTCKDSVLSIDDMVPGKNVRIREIIDREMHSCIGIKRLTVLGRTGYPETIATHIYIPFIQFFELSKFCEDMIKLEELRPNSTKKWIKFVKCHWERDMFYRERIHKDFYSNDCDLCRNYVNGLVDKAVWWFEIGKDKILKMSFKAFYDDYKSFECNYFWIKIFGKLEVQLSLEHVLEGSHIRRSFRVADCSAHILSDVFEDLQGKGNGQDDKSVNKSCVQANTGKIIQMTITSFLLEKIDLKEKCVEARLATPKYSQIQIGDLLSFVCGSKRVSRKVTKKTTYNTFDQMLKIEGKHNCLPGVKSFREALQFYLNLKNYALLEHKFGVVAFHLQQIDDGVFKEVNNYETQSSIKTSIPPKVAEPEESQIRVVKNTPLPKPQRRYGDQVVPVKKIQTSKQVSSVGDGLCEEDDYDLFKEVNNYETQSSIKTSIPPQVAEPEESQIRVVKNTPLPKPQRRYGDQVVPVKKIQTSKQLSSVGDGLCEEDDYDLFKEVNNYETQSSIKTSIPPKLAEPEESQIRVVKNTPLPKPQRRYDDFDEEDFDKEDFDDDELWLNLPSTQEMMKKRIKPQKKSPAQQNPIKKKDRIKWIDTQEVYRMSDELFEIVFDKKSNRLIKDSFLYRKDSIAMEINNLFPGCVIYIDKPNEAKSFLVLRAYCSHINCRKYYLRAYYNDPQTFIIKVNSLSVRHLKPLARQVRRYERDQKGELLLLNFPSSLRESDFRELNPGVTELGNYQKVQSLPVYNVIRKEALAKQDNFSDDLDDVIAMQTSDPKTNFISEVLRRNSPGVYIRSKSQHDILHKLHVKRQVDGTPIVLRMDASGDVARDINSLKLLYHALTVNVTIAADKSSTSLPLTEQYNSHNTSKDIAKWLFDFTLGHSEWHENHAVLADYIISDFSFANFHAVLKAFNGKTLANYLNLVYTWLSKSDEFPAEFYQLVKIKMCYTHLMKTFAEMCRRFYGKPAKLKQHKHCRVIMEILGSMIQATDYKIVVKLWKQLVVLLVNEYVNDDVDFAIVKVQDILSPIDWKNEEFEEDLSIIDVDELPENEPTLYKNNLFYIEFQQYTQKDYFHNNSTETKNIYFNPSFLDKFLKRFVPLIPLWTNILWKSSMKSPNQPLSSTLPIELSQQYASENHQSIKLLNVLHNQPVETHFGNFKRRLMQKAVQLGYPPIKLGRAIVESRSMIDAIIVSINTTTPKSCLNSQKPRKEYVRTKPRPTKQLNKVTKEDENDSTTTFNGSKENYNKRRPLRQFNQMTPHTVTKIATAKIKSSSNLLFYENGLFKSAEFYRNVKVDFVVAKNNERNFLYNNDFDLLYQQKEMSESLMTYITSQFPKSGLQVVIVDSDADETLKIKLVQNTVFVLGFINTWALLVVDKANKAYYIVNPRGDSEPFRNLFLGRVLLPKTFKEKILKTDTTSDDYDSGVFSYSYMKMYLNTGTIPKRKISPGSVRREMEQNLIKNSVDMKECCLICGSDSNDIDVNWGECTNCKRWIHCSCGETTVEEVEADENFQCALCSVESTQ